MRLCAVLLAAGEGTRLRPLTADLPKALCPVGNITLLDRAIAAVGTLGLAGESDVAVNAWYLADAIVEHVQLPQSIMRLNARHAVESATNSMIDGSQGGGGRVHVGVEQGGWPLGSSGGLAALRDWIDGRDVVVGNADAYLAGADLAGLTSGWTGDVVRMLATPADRPAIGDFGRHRFAGFSVIPWRWIESLKAEPTDLVRTVWRPAEAAGQLQIISYGGRYIDCGTPADYLTANLDDAAVRGSHGSIIAPDAIVPGTVAASVVGSGARVYGSVERSVVWPGAVVGPGECLTDAIRYGQHPADTIAIR